MRYLVLSFSHALTFFLSLTLSQGRSKTLRSFLTQRITSSRYITHSSGSAVQKTTISLFLSYEMERIIANTSGIWHSRFLVCVCVRERERERERERLTLAQTLTERLNIGCILESLHWLMNRFSSNWVLLDHSRPYTFVLVTLNPKFELFLLHGFYLIFPLRLAITLIIDLVVGLTTLSLITQILSKRAKLFTLLRMRKI